MKLILDTHTFLWHADGDPRMSPAATARLVDPANELFLSMVTEWEIAIKVGLNKLVLSSPYEAVDRYTSDPSPLADPSPLCGTYAINTDSTESYHETIASTT